MFTATFCRFLAESLKWPQQATYHVVISTVHIPRAIMWSAWCRNPIQQSVWLVFYNILKQHASRLLLIFMKISQMYLKVKYCELNK
jgi:hypothetical protein